MDRILVLRGGALGDFLVTLPALALLRQRWPAAAIHLAGNAVAAQLALARGLVSAVHSQHEARWSALYGPDPLPAAFDTWLREFDLVLNYWPDPDGALRARFPRRPQQVFLSAEALPQVAPAAAHYCAPLAELGLRPTGFLFPLRPLGSSAPPPRSGITIHPGSGSLRKNWPRERWLELLPRLSGPLTLVLGEAEADRWPATAAPAVPRLRCAPLETLVDHLAAARLFLGHDSGISHLAAACGATCLLLFGPTDPAIWAPPSPAVRVLRPPGELAALARPEVEQALAESALPDSYLLR
jgi:heptosyltransferase-3